MVLKGKLTVLNFWFENCPPCLAEIPGLHKLVEKYGSSKINFIAVSTDTKQDVQEFLAKRSFGFKHVANGETIYRDSFQAKWGFPFTIITDRENRILKSFSGGSSDSTAIEEIIHQIEPIIIAQGVQEK